MQIFVPRKKEKEKEKEKSHRAAFLFLDSTSTMFNLQDRGSLGIRTFLHEAQSYKLYNQVHDWHH
jgi:hypothetical protein